MHRKRSGPQFLAKRTRSTRDASLLGHLLFPGSALGKRKSASPRAERSHLRQGGESVARQCGVRISGKAIRQSQGRRAGSPGRRTRSSGDAGSQRRPRGSSKGAGRRRPQLRVMRTRCPASRARTKRACGRRHATRGSGAKATRRNGHAQPRATELVAQSDEAGSPGSAAEGCDLAAPRPRKPAAEGSANPRPEHEETQPEARSLQPRATGSPRPMGAASPQPNYANSQLRD